MPVTVIESQLLHREDGSQDAYVAWLQLGCCVARAVFKSLACLSCDLVSVCGGWGLVCLPSLVTSCLLCNEGRPGRSHISVGLSLCVRLAELRALAQPDCGSTAVWRGQGSGCSLAHL